MLIETCREKHGNEQLSDTQTDSNRRDRRSRHRRSVLEFVSERYHINTSHGRLLMYVPSPEKIASAATYILIGLLVVIVIIAIVGFATQALAALSI